MNRRDLDLSLGLERGRKMTGESLQVDVHPVWEPPWGPARIFVEGREKLGIAWNPLFR
ncbi:MAG: hypothetical protein WCK17_03920 [Verrucomicrobiota bacterium]